MNYEAGLLAFFLFYVPMAIVFYKLYRRDQRIEQEYKDQIKQIQEKYKV